MFYTRDPIKLPDFENFALFSPPKKQIYIHIYCHYNVILIYILNAVHIYMNTFYLHLIPLSHHLLIA